MSLVRAFGRCFQVAGEQLAADPVLVNSLAPPPECSRQVAMGQGQDWGQLAGLSAS